MKNTPKLPYISAPLPFMGQKRKFVKAYRDILATLPDDAVYIDLFGGSGLLAHVTKHTKPNAKVIYNDYDNYRQRLAHIPHTNALLAHLRRATAHLPKDKRIPQEEREQIIALISEAEEEDGYVDYITLSSSLLFSMKYATSKEELFRETFYNSIKQSDYTAEGYLDGLDIVQADYRTIYEEYKDDPKAIFLIDPPYLGTEVATYTMQWTLADYLDVLTILQGHRFVYFTSNKTQIIELCEWLGRNPNLGNPFSEAHRKDVQSTVNYSSTYTDIMLHNLTPLE